LHGASRKWNSNFSSHSQTMLIGKPRCMKPCVGWTLASL
jgi:hypothetical protein